MYKINKIVPFYTVDDVAAILEANPNLGSLVTIPVTDEKEQVEEILREQWRNTWKELNCYEFIAGIEVTFNESLKSWDTVVTISGD